MYRSPNEDYREHFKEFCDVVTSLARPNSIITGDFNIDCMKEPTSNLTKSLEQKGIRQIVRHPTTVYGSGLDHVYIGSAFLGIVDIHYVYYSDHNALKVIVKEHDDINT